MIANNKNMDRSVIPRWRSYNKTLKLGELSQIKSKRNNQIFEDKLSAKEKNEQFFLDEKIKEWKSNNSIPYASELVGAALLSQDYDCAQDAAEYILSNKDIISELLINQAKKILGIKIDPKVENLKDVNSRIKYLKDSLVQYPHNSINWVDLAREYTSIGNLNKAQKAINISLSLSPENRFVLRSASRFFLHANDICRSLSILRRSSKIKYDPWLLASEIAISNSIKTTSPFVRFGKEMIDSKNYDNFELSELESALGTLEFSSGNSKQAKKLINQSLISPNDNSIAQATWLSKWIQLTELNKILNFPYTFEAKTIKLVNESEWDSALVEAKYWACDLSYSKIPIIFGSYIAATALEDFERSERISRDGLKANPKEFTILNNLCFSLLSQNKILEGEQIFNKMKIDEDIYNNIVYYATKGLLLFRKKNFDEGRENYYKAIQLAHKAPNKNYKVASAIYLAREEMLINSDNFPKILNDVSKYIQNIDDTIILQLYKNTLENKK